MSKPELITTKQKTIANVSEVVTVQIKKSTDVLTLAFENRREIAADNVSH